MELVLEAGKNIENYTKTEIDVMNDLACLPYSSVINILVFKVEKILKGSLDSISSPSPSVKIQIMGGKGVKAKHRWMLSTNF